MQIDIKMVDLRPMKSNGHLEIKRLKYESTQSFNMKLIS